MLMEITSSGGARVEARYEGHTIATDQPVKAGGEDSAPAPFDLFLASIGTCAGYYAFQFCRQRELSTEGLAVALETIFDSERHRIGRIRISVQLPESFPEKYRPAILRSIDQCSVKRHILEPPEFEVTVGDAIAAV
jgi:ribosomal protein S12 methylthiotransferase accessory factor